MKWAYFILKYRNGTCVNRDIDSTFSEYDAMMFLGMQGWELVGVIIYSEDYRPVKEYYFKKPLGN